MLHVARVSHVLKNVCQRAGATAAVAAAALCAPLFASPGAPAMSESAVASAAADPGQAPAPGGGSPMFFIVIMGAMLLMIVMTFRSQRKEKNKRQEMINQLAIGKKVVTIGGIVGSVTRLGDDTIDLKTGDITMEVSRGAVNRIVEDGEKVPDPHQR